MGINHRSGLGIGNISRSQSKQTFYSADHAANGAADHRTDGACGLATNRSAVLDAISFRTQSRTRNCRLLPWSLLPAFL
jgi:hypothetical protein